MKKYIFSLALILAIALLFAIHPQPQAYASCAGADTSIINCSDSGNSGEGINYILKLVFTIMTYGAGALCVMGIIIVGILYMTARDSTERVAKAKKRLAEVVIGLALFAGFGTIVNFLVPGGVLISDSSPSGSGQTNVINSSSQTGSPSNPSQTGAQGSGGGSGSSSSPSSSSSNTPSPTVGNRQSGSESTAGMTGSVGNGNEGWLDWQHR